MKETSGLMESAETIGRFFRLWHNTKKTLPIRSSEMGMLIFIQRSAVPVTPFQISQFFDISKPSVTTMTQALLKGGYIERTTKNHDRRSYTLELTTKGLELACATERDYLDSVHQLQDRLGAKDFEVLINLLERAVQDRTHKEKK